MKIRGKVGNDPRDQAQIDNMLSKYTKQVNEINENRNIASIHYAQGRQAGLPQRPYEDIQRDYLKQDEDLRENYLNEGDEYYINNNGLAKYFNDNMEKKPPLKDTFNKANDKDFDKDR